MGFGSLFEAHPFTIAAVSENPRGEGLVLYAKAVGDWTDKLYEIASGSGANDGAEKMIGSEGDVGQSQSATMRMVLEGPYGE